MEDLVYKLMNANKALRYLEEAKEQVSHWEYEVSQLTNVIALFDKQVTFDGETTTVAKLIDKIIDAQDSVNYMTFETNDRMSRQKQRETQARLDGVFKLAEKAIQEAA